MKQCLHEFFHSYDPTDHYGDIKGSIVLLVFHAVMVISALGICGVVR